MIRLSEIYSQLTEEVNKGETPQEFFDRFNKDRNGKDPFLKNHFKNPNFQLRLSHNGGVKFDNACGEYNRCETNTFNYIKRKVKNNDHRFFPVSGWAFTEGGTRYEHFWVYDAVNDLFLDVTPMHGNSLAYAYGGVINKDINDEILNSEHFHEVKFLLGKHHTSLYSDYLDNESNPNFNEYNPKNYEEELFKYISSNEKYEELNDVLNNYNVHTLNDLKKIVHSLEKNQMATRQSAKYEYYDKLIKQIKNLL